MDKIGGFRDRVGRNFLIIKAILDTLLNIGIASLFILVICLIWYEDYIFILKLIGTQVIILAANRELYSFFLGGKAKYD